MSGAESEDAIAPCSQDSEVFAALGFSELARRLMCWTASDLTEVLKLNKVTSSGVKAVKVDRIVSYVTHGVLAK